MDATTSKRSEDAIQHDISSTYSSLEPECLSCDGELSREEVAARYRTLHARLKALFVELGREVSEDESWAWWEHRGRTYLAEQRAVHAVGRG